MPTYANRVDQFLDASKRVQDTARSHAERYTPMTTQLREPLPREQQQAYYDRVYRPKIESGDVAGALKLVAQQAPLGSDYRKELQLLVKNFGGG